ncbi:MAG: serine/threonine-protein kinase [Planctomycetota bacterium]|nr:MAG: serine/threonine-protein kinase [Planctomycetota bacterium]
MQSAGQLLVELVVRERPEAAAAARRALEATSTTDPDALASVGQALIRAKAISAREFLACQALVEEALRRRCPGCGDHRPRLAGPRPLRERCSCGRVYEIAPARSPFAASSLRTAARAPTVTNDGGRVRTGYTSRRRRGEAAEDPAPSKGPVPERIGPYLVAERIGDGGMGVVYAALEPETGRRVALKLLRRGASDDAKARFEREAQAVARLNHPAIVKVHDVGRDPASGSPFFTMDLVEGRDLLAAGPALSLKEFIDLVATVAEALHHAHEQGIVHRDVKPQNILVDGKGRPRIADFGLARDLGRSSLTEVGDLVGTPLFMSPEQLRGDPSAIDRRTDVYALGVLLYERLAGRLPVEAGSLYELQAKVREGGDPPPPSSLGDAPSELDGVVLRALAKDPDRRYPTAAALAADLRRYLDGERVEARPHGALARWARACGTWLRSPWGTVVVGSAFMLALVGVLVFVLHRRSVAERVAREALEGRRSACLAALAEGRAALEAGLAAWGEGERDRALGAAERAKEALDRARDLARGLGTNAPAGVGAADRELRGKLGRLRARALAAGPPEDQERARALLEASLAANGEDPDGLVLLGRLELRRGRPEAAARRLQRALILDAARADAFFYKGDAERLAGRPEYARLDYERALEGAEGLRGVSPARVLAGAGLASLELGDPEAAEEALRNALERDAGEPRVALLRAALLRARGEGEASLAELRRAVRTWPAEAELHEAAARAWAAAGVAPRALAELEAALELRRGPLLWLARARLHDLLGEAQAADADFLRAQSACEPGGAAEARVHLARARALRARGSFDEALAELSGDGAGGSRPSTHAARLERAELLAAIGELGAATPLLAEAAREGASRARALRTAAWIALTRADLARARQEAEKLLQGRPEDPVGLTLLAHARRLAGDEVGAREVEARARAARRALSGRVPGLWLAVGDPFAEALTALHLAAREGARARSATGAEAQALRRRERIQRERAVRLAPWWVPARVALAEALARAGDADAALAELGRARVCGSPTVAGERLRGQLLAAAGRTEEALLAYDRALEGLGEGDGTAERRRRGRILLERARALEQAGETERALRDLDRAIAEDTRLLAAYELRARVHARRGDTAAADADRERVELLRSGYVSTYEAARREAWRRRSQGDHQGAQEALAPAFELVDRERDPERRAELYWIRGYMRVRCVQLAEALTDFAAMLELAPDGFRLLHDELGSLARGEGRIALRLEPVLERVLAARDEQDDVDPDFLLGYVAYVSCEFDGGGPEGRLRAGIQALDRYVAAHPGRPAGQLLRAALLLRAGQRAEATRTLLALLDGARPPAYAHYLLARLQTAEGDPAAALRSLEDALRGGYDVYEAVARDEALDPLREHPGYAPLLARSQGRGYLQQALKAERLSLAQRGEERAQTEELVLRAVATGLGFLRDGLRAGEAGARRVAADLYWVRGRVCARRGERRRARAALAAALEADPARLLAGAACAEAARAVSPLGAAPFRSARGEAEDPLPSRVRAALGVVLAVLAGEAPTPEERTEAERLLRDAEPPLRALRAVLLLGAGDAEVALRAAREGRAQDPNQEFLAGEAVARREAFASWLEARVHAAKGEEAEALAALEGARARGWSPFPRDPAFDALRGNARYRALAHGRDGLRAEERWRR